MVNNEYVEEFKKVMNKGKWRERYRVVKNNYFITNGLVDETTCQKILINAALKDTARLVRQPFYSFYRKNSGNIHRFFLT